MLVVDSVNKSYGKKQVLFDLSFTFERGVYGLLGPNGAGKSTLLQIMTGNLKCEKGQVLYKGKDIRRFSKAYFHDLGYVPQVQGMYEMFTAFQFLSYMAGLKGIPRRKIAREEKRVLEVAGLTEEAGQKLSTYSGGMKQRILIAQALLGNPKVLILDEPTAGLDPKERIRIRNFISRLSEKRTVIFATHVVSDVESIAKEIILLGDGRIQGCGSTKELCASLEGKVFSCETEGGRLEELEKRGLVSNIQELSDGKIMVRMIGEKKRLESEKGVTFTEAAPNLQEVYLYLFSDAEGGG